jgi:hypothetical protein
MVARVGAMRGREEMGTTGKGRRLNPRRGWRRGGRGWVGWALSGSGLGATGARLVRLRFIFTDVADGLDRLRRISNSC